MAYTTEKTGTGVDIIVAGYEQGIAPSPHKGIANIQNANISTETGEVMASYGRIQATMTSSNSTGSLSFSDSTHVDLSGIGNGLFKGSWITVTGSTHTGELANGNYYVLPSFGTNFQLATSYGGSIITGYTSGLTASISLIRTMGRGVAYTTEVYQQSGTTYYRYYVLDHQGLVWVYDTQNDAIYSSTDKVAWFLPDNDVGYFSGDTAPSGIAVLNGWLFVLSGNKFWVKPTVNLGSSYVQATNAYMMSRPNSAAPHYALVGHQGRMYYTDGDFVGSIFPDTSLAVSGLPNIQSYASYTAVTTTGTLSNLISGSVPSDGNIVSLRVPAVFFPATGGTRPTNLTVNVVYYIEYSLALGTFGVFAAATGGAAIDIASGAVGTQYYNTFFPVGTHAAAGGDHSTMVFSNQRVNLPTFEVSQCLVEIGNTVLIGCRGSVVYPWNQVDATPSGLINLPEANVAQMLTVNQMAYIFAGYKANVYITDGSTASLVIKVPDYCAGVPGTPNSYFEPNFTWGGVAYIRGRVYFSVLDQTTTKAGNCGGIWSFIPTQNLYIGQDTGISLRMENQNSYGTYSGYATLIIPFFDQSVGKSPQFWSAWQSALTSITYGIDKTDTSPVGTVVIESDLIPVGTYLSKYTPKQIEYKLASPLVAGESVAIYWRKNATDAWASAGTAIREGSTSLSGYFNANFQGAQWVQLQAILTPLASTSTSFVRFAELRMR